MNKPEHEVSAAALATRSDEELLSLLKGNDAAACERFVRDHMPRALAAARRLVGNEADAYDATQDAFLSFFRSLGSFRQDATLSTWLHRIVINAALMRRRSKQRRPETAIEDLLPCYLSDGHRANPVPVGEASAESLAERREVKLLVRRKIEELPEEYRNVILLRDIEQLDTAETARLLNDTPGAVKTRLHRARQALRTLLEREDTFGTRA